VRGGEAGRAPAPPRLAYTRDVVWELFFMLVVLKIPVVYLCAVVWWAIRAEPRPLEGAASPAVLAPAPLGPGTCDWRRPRRARMRRRPPVGPRPGRVAA
jgi:hypothetical protein